MRHLRGPYPPMAPGRTRRSRRKHPSKNNQDDNTRPLATHGTPVRGRSSDGTTSTAITTNRHADPLTTTSFRRPQPQPYRPPREHLSTSSRQAARHDRDVACPRTALGFVKGLPSHRRPSPKSPRASHHARARVHRRNEPSDLPAITITPYLYRRGQDPISRSRGATIPSSHQGFRPPVWSVYGA